jgi:hypothetical protein
MRVTPTTDVVTTTLLTDAQAADLFDAIKTQTFTDANGVTRSDDWNYGLDECFLRAADAADTARAKGYVPGKEFIWSTDNACNANLSFQTPVAPDATAPGQQPKPITWRYHVGERETGTLGTQQVALVFDPATQQQAVPAWQWAAAIDGGRTPEILTVDEVNNLLSANRGSLPCGHTYMWEAPGTQVFPTSDSGDANPNFAKEIQSSDLSTHTTDANIGDLDALAADLRALESSKQVSAANIQAAAAGATPAARANFATHFPNLTADLAQALGEVESQTVAVDVIAGLVSGA